MIRVNLLVKRCSYCTHTLPIKQFDLTKRADGQIWKRLCKECAEYSRVWHQKKRDKMTPGQKVQLSAEKKAYGKKVRMDCIQAYGGKCECCGETHFEFLEIDHPNNDGNKERRALGKWGTSFFAHLRTRGFPAGYRVLCGNCNAARYHFGECPHERERREVKQLEEMLTA